MWTRFNDGKRIVLLRDMSIAATPCTRATLKVTDARSVEMMESRRCCAWLGERAGTVSIVKLRSMVRLAKFNFSSNMSMSSKKKQGRQHGYRHGYKVEERNDEIRDVVS